MHGFHDTRIQLEWVWQLIDNVRVLATTFETGRFAAQDVRPRSL